MARIEDIAKLMTESLLLTTNHGAQVLLNLNHVVTVKAVDQGLEFVMSSGQTFVFYHHEFKQFASAAEPDIEV